jgi:MYXO-CTERM domain-containing protein
MRVLPALSLGVALSVAHGPGADAAQVPAALQHAAEFELADSAATTARLPAPKVGVAQAAAPLWAGVGIGDLAWRAMWNSQTGVAQRIFGAGISAPGALRSPAAAEAHARAALRANLHVLAPGASEGDFELAANHLDETGMRTVSFFQYSGGVPVLGGQVNFRFRNDRLFMMGSEAYPHVRAPAALTAVSNRVARDRARRWIESDFGPKALPPSDAAGPYILPIVRGVGDIDYRQVMAVQVEAPEIPASWEVYVDGATGEPVARRQTLAFGSATALFDVPVRYPQDERANLPASFLALSVGAFEAVSDLFGVFSWGGNDSQQVSFNLRGPFVRVNNSGADVRGERSIEDGAVEVFGAPDNELIDAQVALFVHTNIAKEYVRRYTANPWLDQQLQVFANLEGECNAFYSPVQDSIHFLTQGEQCNNTGRLADVIYHEFGHAIHANAIIPGVGSFDGAMSEGVSDYLAATITDDPGMGRGFFLGNLQAALRHLDPESIGGTRRIFPRDVTGQVHTDGQIIGATLWQLREELIAAHGEAEGIAQADRIWYGIIQRSTTLPTAYAEALAADDDDGDLSNGTPNSCIINRAFADGGLGDASAAVVPGIEPPAVSGYALTLPVREPDGCEVSPIGYAEVRWQRRGDEAASGSVILDPATGGFAGQLPEQPEDSVLQYQVEVVFQNGSSQLFPNNPADDHYELFVGELEEIYATTFEDDPFENGWTSGADTGDDVWAWGEPGGVGLGGGPTAAYAGANVLATDLAQHSYGLYPRDALLWVESPAIDISELEEARLQFRRWLAVEDGFFDQARIYVNGELVWENFNSNQGNQSNVHHLDREWRFQDLDLAAFLPDETVQIRFELQTDGGLEFAGWAIDELRVVGRQPAPACPDFEAGEVCDGECPPGCEPPPVEDDDDGAIDDEISPAGCGCSAGGAAGAPGAGPALLGMLLVTVVARLRRRRVVAA